MDVSVPTGLFGANTDTLMFGANMSGGLFGAANTGGALCGANAGGGLSGANPGSHGGLFGAPSSPLVSGRLGALSVEGGSSGDQSGIQAEAVESSILESAMSSVVGAGRVAGGLDGGGDEQKLVWRPLLHCPWGIQQGYQGYGPCRPEPATGICEQCQTRAPRDVLHMFVVQNARRWKAGVAPSHVEDEIMEVDPEAVVLIEGRDEPPNPKRTKGSPDLRGTVWIGVQAGIVASLRIGWSHT